MAQKAQRNGGVRLIKVKELFAGIGALHKALAKMNAIKYIRAKGRMCDSFKGNKNDSKQR